MGCIDSALSNLFPTDWLDPYGNMPLNKEYSVQIDITQVETDDGIKVTAVKTPPRAGTTSIQDAINMALGFCCSPEADESDSKNANSMGNKTSEDKTGSQNAIQRSADLGKRDEKNSEDSGKMNPADHQDFGRLANRDRNPGSGGSENPDQARPSGDTKKEKTPWK